MCTRRLLLCLTAVSASLFSCKKNSVSSYSFDASNHLRNEWESTVKIDQAISFYDATALNDSLLYVQPPANRYYEWHVLPDNGCATFWGNYKYGKPNVTFKCAGDYKVFGSIFDSASREQIGVTDTLNIQVSNDTLKSAQPLQRNDQLLISASLVKRWNNVQASDPFPPVRPPDEVSVALGLKTNEQYEYQFPYTEIPVTPTISGDSYSYVFADSVKLIHYPFALGTGTFVQIQQGIILNKLKYGVPADLRITWLGKTYTGKVTLLNEYGYTIKWTNDGDVKFVALLDGSMN